jgi:hypothetical protein
MALLRYGATLLALAVSGPVAAVNHALLIGVGDYPNLAPELQLKAPANDVRLMREVLLRRGFDAARIEVLADGVSGARPPTREAIIAALERLAAQAREGDTVLLHYSGHGSLQPVARTQGASPSGPEAWQPVFLPRDAQGWDGKSDQTVTNAITDTTLRTLVDRINDSGAFVFALFDACHSAKLVRGALPSRELSQVRQVLPSALGFGEEPPADVWPVMLTTLGAAPDSADARRRRGKAVYFYAAQSHELAAAAPTGGGGSTNWHGLFTWNIARALALGQPMSYRQLGQHVLFRYERLSAAPATPVYAGDGLDEPVFGASAPAVRQWPLEQHQGRLSVAAGTLWGLGEGALLAVLADPLAPAMQVSTQPTTGTLGFLRVVAADAERAMLEPVAWQGWAALKPGTLSSGLWARLLHNVPTFALRVATDRGNCAEPCTAGRALALLRRDGVVGVDVRWADVAGNADVVLRATDRGVRLRLPTDGDNTEGFGFSATPGDESQRVETLASQVAAGLHRLARSRNLLELSARLALRPAQGPGLGVTVAHRTPGAEGERTARPDQLVRVRVGDVLTVGGRNDAGDPVDVAIFWLGSDSAVRQVYPRDRRETPRLAAGERLRRFGLQIDPGSRGTERLLVLSAPMRAGREASDFRFLEQSPLNRLRGSDDSELQALLDACFADHRLRGDAAPALPPQRLRMQVFTFQIDP